MKKILFYDNTINNYFYKLNCESIILDYFDIEVQKILPVIGYSFKRNPLLFKYHSGEFDDLAIEYFCNIRKPIVKHISKESLLPNGIIFECYH